MPSWSGRSDPPGQGDSRRWHQVVRPVAADAGPGVALLGFACDEGIRRNQGRRGAAHGPAALRGALANLPVLEDGFTLYDAGDVVCEGEALEFAQDEFARRISALLDAGHRPIGLGGGHEIGFASYLGLAGYLRDRRPRVAIVNFDAHFDLRDQEQASSGTPFLQALDHAAAHAIDLRYLCIGASASANTRQLFATADQRGVHYLRDDELDPRGLDRALGLLVEWLADVDLIYLTICLDVLPHPLAPGVSAPSARGVPLEVLEPLLDAVLASRRVVLLDVAELSPPFDRDNATARVAARLVHRASGGLAAAGERLGQASSASLDS